MARWSAVEFPRCRVYAGRARQKIACQLNFEFSDESDLLSTEAPDRYFPNGAPMENWVFPCMARRGG